MAGLILTDVINDIQGVPHDYDAATIIAGIDEFTRVAHESCVSVTVMSRRIQLTATRSPSA